MPASSIASASPSSIWPSRRELGVCPRTLAPLAVYERTGDVPNVVFPCGLLHDAASDEIRLYYGAADSSICIATARLGDLLDAIIAAPQET